MKTQTLGNTDIQVTRLCYGAMRIANSWDRDKVDAAAIERGIKSLESAVEAGYNFIDHADIYGDTTCEMIYGKALAKHPDWRDKLVVATKCGIRFEDEPPGTPASLRFQRRPYPLVARRVAEAAESRARRSLSTAPARLARGPRGDRVGAGRHPQGGQGPLFRREQFQAVAGRGGAKRAPLPARLEPGADSFAAGRLL